MLTSKGRLKAMYPRLTRLYSICRRINVRPILILVWINLIIFGLTLPGSESAFFDGYTHALFDEHFTATWCPSCRSDEPNVMKTYDQMAGSFFVVSYHVSDEFSNPSGNSMITQYQVRTIPYHVFDGGNLYRKGGIISMDLRAPGARPVHRVSLAVKKVIHGNTLEYQGSVQEMDGEKFVGFVQVYVTENKLRSEGIEWNFVFRAFGIKEPLDIGANAFGLFSGTWTIPSNVKVENVVIVAAVFDSSTVGNYGPFVVQAVDDSRSSQVIPEMKAPVQVVALVLFLVTIVFFKRRRRTIGPERVT